MKISEILKRRPTLSFEVFPPKKGRNISTIYSTIESLAMLSPDFISVTYGAGGSTKRSTVEIAARVKQQGVEPVAHLTGLSTRREEVIDICQKLDKNGVENILALRGDIPADGNYSQGDGDFEHADRLMRFIEEKFPGKFCLSGACYPEVHNDSDGLKEDIKALKSKQDSGAKYLVTQIFYDNRYYYRLVKEARKAGVTIPVLAGIMPAVNAKSLIRTARMCGASIPYDLSTMLQKYYDSPRAMKEVGITYAAQQIADLITNGVDGIHIYTMNRPRIAKSIFECIPTILGKLRRE